MREIGKNPLACIYEDLKDMNCEICQKATLQEDEYCHHCGAIVCFCCQIGDHCPQCIRNTNPVWIGVDLASTAISQHLSGKLNMENCEHIWVSNSGEGGPPRYTTMGMHVCCCKCNGRTWVTQEQWEALLPEEESSPGK